MAGGPTVRLDGGPGHGQIYFEEDFRDRIKAAKRIHRTEPDAAGWALGYAPGGLSATGGRLWTWHGINCHPASPDGAAGSADARRRHRAARRAHLACP